MKHETFTDGGNINLGSGVEIIYFPYIIENKYGVDIVLNHLGKKVKKQSGYSYRDTDLSVSDMYSRLSDFINLFVNGFINDNKELIDDLKKKYQYER